MSATVPMEFSFGTGGNLKSARRLRNLDLKRDRPTVHPLFGNTGSVVTQAYAATGFKPKPVMTNSVSVKPPVGGRSALPLKSGTKLINQGIASEQTSGGELLQAPRPPAPEQTAIVPTQSQPPVITTQQKGGFFSSGKNVALAGGGLIALVLVIYTFFGGSKKRKNGKRKSNGNTNKKARGRRSRR